MRSEHQLERSQSWEDPHLLLQILRPTSEDDLLSVAGAGESLFALMSGGVRSVFAFDPSFPQMALVGLKQTAIRMLPIQSVRSFLGLGHFGRRVWFYHYLRGSLPDAVRRYWDAREEPIRAGLLQSGLWEQELRLFRQQLGWIRSKEAVEALLTPRPLEQQAAFYRDHWDGIRWRIFLRKFMDPVTLKRAESRLGSLPLSSNFLLRQALTGEFLDLEGGYPSLSSEGHSRLQAQMLGMRLEWGEPEAVFEKLDPGRFSCVFLGDLLESSERREPILRALSRILRPGARVLWWGSQAPCPLPERLNGTWLEQKHSWLQQDRAMFRASVHLAIRC